MDDKTDITTFILRFIFGAILGVLLSLVLMVAMIWANILIPKLTLFVVAGLITLAGAICGTIWGDKFLSGFIKIFQIFKFFP